MPEGPSIVILRERIESLHLEGEKIIEVYGDTSIDKERMLNQTVIAFKTWGKHLLICFKDFSLRIHLMMFGSYRINERKASQVRIGLKFPDAELNFYTCVLKYIEGDLKKIYDWSVDVLSDDWDPQQAFQKIRKNPEAKVCDILLDQQIFSGVGNIIKNEVLYRIGVHPLSKIESIIDPLLNSLIEEARRYSFDFLRWKKENTLKKHWLIYSKNKCPLKHNVEKRDLGKNKRLTFFCNQCQKLYKSPDMFPD